MAARRVLSLLLSKQPRTSSSSLKESFSQVIPAANSFFQRDGLRERGLRTIVEDHNRSVEDSLAKESCNLNSDSSSSDAISSPVSNEDSIRHRVTSSLKISETHDLAMIFTCKVCDTRSVKTCSRASYEKGVVLARCGGCNNVHLIADRLGWFGEPGSIEEFLAARGEEVKKGSADTLNLTLEDMAGKEKLDV
ncbi:uncharacterized protein [Coffea arabica]|uniref:DNL-type domain-containing protein n=1 Tax=Coffea arabica TaxID=13443 RepID=A0A6P6W1B1_COFAR|nr:DNL-type zinc finger protein [Coffea arabica]